MATRTFLLLLCIQIVWGIALSYGAERKTLEESQDNPRTFKDYERCDWLVTYRSRTYDLAPLTKGSLSRPIDGDIRAVIRRVPEAGAHLDEVERSARLGRTHSIIGSGGITTLLLSRIFRADPKLDDNPSKRKTIDLIGLAGLLIFVKSTLDSSYHAERARSELVEAVRVFNDTSSYKIAPYEEGK